jgi:hypothetical protein
MREGTTIAPTYRVRAIEPCEIITDMGDRIIVGCRIRSLLPSDIVLAIERERHIVAVLAGGKLSYSHADHGVVHEDCADVGAAVKRMRVLIGDEVAA